VNAKLEGWKDGIMDKSEDKEFFVPNFPIFQCSILPVSIGGIA
jgi:hypothetical protein